MSNWEDGIENHIPNFTYEKKQILARLWLQAKSPYVHTSDAETKVKVLVVVGQMVFLHLLHIRWELWVV